MAADRGVIGGNSEPSHLTGVDLPIFLGEERITLNGAGVACTFPPPPSVNRFILAAELGDVRFRFNGMAHATSPGYVPENGIVDIVTRSLTTLSVYGGAGSFANLLYFHQPSHPHP